MPAIFQKNNFNIRIDIEGNINKIMEKLDKKILPQSDRFTDYYFQKEVDISNRFITEKFPNKYIPAIVEYYKISDISELENILMTVHFLGSLMIPRFCIELLLFNITQKEYVLEDFEYELLSNIVILTKS